MSDENQNIYDQLHLKFSKFLDLATGSRCTIPETTIEGMFEAQEKHVFEVEQAFIYEIQDLEKRLSKAETKCSHYENTLCIDKIQVIQNFVLAKEISTVKVSELFAKIEKYETALGAIREFEAEEHEWAPPMEAMVKIAKAAYTPPTKETK